MFAVSKNNPHRKGILSWACMPPIISKIILPEGEIINRVLLIERYLHVSTFYSDCHSLDTVYKCNMTYCDSESCCSSHYDANVDYSEDYNYDWIYYDYPEYDDYGMEYTHGVQKGERRDCGFQGQVSTQSPQSQTIPYCYNPQSPMMKHPS